MQRQTPSPAARSGAWGSPIAAPPWPPSAGRTASPPAGPTGSIRSWTPSVAPASTAAVWSPISPPLMRSNRIRPPTSICCPSTAARAAVARGRAPDGTGDDRPAGALPRPRLRPRGTVRLSRRAGQRRIPPRLPGRTARAQPGGGRSARRHGAPEPARAGTGPRRRAVPRPGQDPQLRREAQDNAARAPDRPRGATLELLAQPLAELDWLWEEGAAALRAVWSGQKTGLARRLSIATAVQGADWVSAARGNEARAFGRGQGVWARHNYQGYWRPRLPEGLEPA